jgi:hypothetical protein
MMKPPSRGANVYRVALVAWSIAFTILLVQQWWFVESGFLYRDDTVIIPSTLESGHFRDLDFAFLWYMQVLSWLGSLPIDSQTALAVFKVVVLALFACVPALLAVLFFRIASIPWLSVGAALAISSYPLAVDQGATYLSAAHPTYGVAVAIVALGVFWFSWKAQTPKFLAGIVVVAVLTYLASFASPTLRLMVVVPVLWIMVMSIFDWRGWKRSAIALAVMLLPLALRVTHVTEHHYAAVPGRVDVSISTILGNALNGIRMAVAPLADASWIILLLYVAGLAILVFAVFRARPPAAARDEDQTRGSPTGTDMAIFLGLCVLTAALAFGPPSVLTVFRPRYVVPAFLLIALGLGAIVVWRVRLEGGATVLRLAVAGVTLLIAANVFRAGAMQDKPLGTALLTHEAMKKLVAEDRGRWGDGSQVVTLVTRPQRTPTNGSMHRSVWYLRYLTGGQVQMGLVGRVDMLGFDPFVEASLKAPDLKMRGLREDFPLYLYNFDKSGGRFVPCDVLFLGDDPAQTKFAKFGEAPAMLPPADLSWGFCQPEERPIFVWPMTPDALQRHEAGANPCVRR